MSFALERFALGAVRDDDRGTAREQPGTVRAYGFHLHRGGEAGAAPAAQSGLFDLGDEGAATVAGRAESPQMVGEAGGRYLREQPGCERGLLAGVRSRGVAGGHGGRRHRPTPG